MGRLSDIWWCVYDGRTADNDYNLALFNIILTIYFWGDKRKLGNLIGSLSTITHRLFHLVITPPRLVHLWSLTRPTYCFYSREIKVKNHII